MTQAVKLAQLGSPGISTGFKNRIINGAMVIDQRNAGATVAAPNDGQLVLDRFAMFRVNSAGVYSVGQSSTAPAGFTNSMLCTVTTADASVTAGDYYLFYQAVEGYNVADLGFGTANAQTVTVSFWVRSSVTGTYAVSIRQGSGARSYVTTYTVSSANTWEQKSVTIAGDTSGTWNKTNGAGLILSWDLGSGSNYTTTANSWQSGNYFKASGCVDWISTNGATFYITGVQLEIGTTATDFEYLDYGRQLMMCQRYFVKYGGQASVEVVAPIGMGATSTVGLFNTTVPVEMRTVPTIAFSTINLADAVNPAVAVTSAVLETGLSSTKIASVSFTVSSGIASNRPLYARTANTTGYVNYSAEL